MVPTRKTLPKRIYETDEHSMQSIKETVAMQPYICSTADIWSNKKRSFLGVTIHWIDERFDGKSIAIACKRFKGTYSYKNISELL